ncbi:MAG: hypothetical protein IMY86_14170 [Chloroflexi bacterium]|nr:hypothetical protein [Chloroflexota bacterium]
MTRPKPLVPGRVRAVEHPFGWVPFRLLTSGILKELSAEASLLYFFLTLVADPKGLSYWSDERMEQQLGLPQGLLELARQELLDRDLVAHGGMLYQVLSLPSTPRASARTSPQTVDRTDA